MFQAAATLFSAKGFDGVSVDDIAALAGVNKAMIYYHFADKIALYRSVVADMLMAVSEKVAAIAESPITPSDKLDRFVENFVRMADARPWFPTLMMREISEGAPHLDLDTLGHIRSVFLGFGRILKEGEAAGIIPDDPPDSRLHLDHRPADDERRARARCGAARAPTPSDARPGFTRRPDRARPGNRAADARS